MTWIPPHTHTQHQPCLTASSTYTSEGKLFAPGNLRAIEDNPGYAALHQYWLKNKYQVRSCVALPWVRCCAHCHLSMRARLSS